VWFLIKHSSPGDWRSSLIHDQSFSTQMRSPATCAVHGLWSRGTGAKRTCFFVLLFFFCTISHYVLGCAGRERRYNKQGCAFWSLFTHLNFASGFFWFLLLYLHLRMMIIWSSCSRCQKPPLPFHLWELVTLRWGDHSSLRRRDDLLSSIDSESIFNGRGDGGASCRTFLKISWTKIS
jgi:hypothetical protein